MHAMPVDEISQMVGLLNYETLRNGFKDNTYMSNFVDVHGSNENIIKFVSTDDSITAEYLPEVDFESREGWNTRVLSKYLTLLQLQVSKTKKTKKRKVLIQQNELVFKIDPQFKIRFKENTEDFLLVRNLRPKVPQKQAKAAPKRKSLAELFRL